MTGADRDLVKVWQKMNAPRFDRIMLNTKTVSAEAKPDGIWVKFEGEGAPPNPSATTCAAGRGPHAQRQEDRGRQGRRCGDRPRLHPVDIQMRTNVPSIFAIGDLVGQPMLAHKAVHEAHVAPKSSPANCSAMQSWQERLQRPRDPERGLHRPRSGVGGRDRRRRQGAWPQDRKRACSPGRPPAAPSPNTRDEGFKPS